jgi:hypothetical protein
MDFLRPAYRSHVTASFLTVRELLTPATHNVLCLNHGSNALIASNMDHMPKSTLILFHILLYIYDI